MYFDDVTSLEGLKEKYRSLLKENHPDNGGDDEKMKEINVEYDALFAVWKSRVERETGQKVNETADSTRSRFYTEFGWEGENHSWNRSLKEVAQIVREYVKGKYPTYKFSVRTSYGSMCQELQVELKESPVEIYKTFEQMTQEDKEQTWRKMMRAGLFRLDSWKDEELKLEFERIWKENGNSYRCLTDEVKAVTSDVDAFVNSYNFKDCDGRIDYFDVDFYYFSCLKGNGVDVKIVPKVEKGKAVREKKAAKPAAERKEKMEKETAKVKDVQPEKETEKVKDVQPEKEASEDVFGLNVKYAFTKETDTRDGSDLWVLRLKESLEREVYLKISSALRERGGFYSRFKGGFVFHKNPVGGKEGNQAA